MHGTAQIQECFVHFPYLSACLSISVSDREANTDLNLNASPQDTSHSLLCMGSCLLMLQ